MRNSYSFKRGKQAGFTFVELSIAIVIMTAAYLMIANVIVPKYQSWKASIEAQSASMATQAVKKQAPNGDFGSGSLNLAIATDIRGNYANIGTAAAPSFKNSYGGGFTVIAGGSQATISDTGLPPAACQAVVMQIAANYSDASVSVASKSWSPGVQIAPNDAAAACVASTNSVAWVVSAGL